MFAIILNFLPLRHEGAKKYLYFFATNARIKHMKIDLCFAHLRLFANAYLPQKVKSYDLKALNIVIIVQVSSDCYRSNDDDHC